MFLPYRQEAHYCRLRRTDCPIRDPHIPNRHHRTSAYQFHAAYPTDYPKEAYSKFRRHPAARWVPWYQNDSWKCSLRCHPHFRMSHPCMMYLIRQAHLCLRFCCWGSFREGCLSCPSCRFPDCFRRQEEMQEDYLFRPQQPDRWFQDLQMLWYNLRSCHPFRSLHSWKQPYPHMKPSCKGSKWIRRWHLSYLKNSCSI